MGVLSGSNSLMTMDRTRGASYLAERKAAGAPSAAETIEAPTVSRKSLGDLSSRSDKGSGGEARDAAAAERADAMGTTAEQTGFYSGAETLSGMRDAMGVEKAVTGITGSKAAGWGAQKALEMALNVTGLGAAYGLTRATLGGLAAVTGAFEEGVIGDVLGSRTREAERDVVEDAGFSDVAGLAQTDRRSRALGLDDSAFGLSAAYGSTTAGMLGSAAAAAGFGTSDMFGGYQAAADPFGTEIGLSNIGDFGFDGSDTGFGDTGGFGVDSDVSGMGDIGDIGQTSHGSFSGSLGDTASSFGGYGKGDAEGGGGDSDSGGSTGNDGGVGGSADCFVGDTLITMANGEAIPIKDIKVGMEVLSFNKDGGLEAGRVNKLKPSVSRGTVLATMSNGKKVECTPRHRFVQEDGTYERIGQLESGNVLDKDGSLVEVISVNPTGNSPIVYNFEVSVNHTYIANGFRVHNWK